LAARQENEPASAAPAELQLVDPSADPEPAEAAAPANLFERTLAAIQDLAPIGDPQEQEDEDVVVEPDEQDSEPAEASAPSVANREGVCLDCLRDAAQEEVDKVQEEVSESFEDQLEAFQDRVAELERMLEQRQDDAQESYEQKLQSVEDRRQ